MVVGLTAEMIGEQGNVWLPKVADVIRQRMAVAIAESR